MFKARVVSAAATAFVASACAVGSDTDDDTDVRAHADPIVLSTVEDTHLLLGDGFDTVKESPKGNCFNNLTSATVGTGKSSVDFVKDVDVSSFASELSTSASAKGTFGVVSAGASMSFARSLQSRGGVYTLLYSNRISLGWEKIKTSELKIKPEVSPTYFQSVCGDEYVQSVERGGHLYLSYQLEFATESEKQSWAVSASVSSGPYAVAADIKGSLDAFKGRVKVTIRALQQGGDQSGLALAFGNSNAIISCDPTNIDACNAVVKKVLDYATASGDFAPAKKPAVSAFPLTLVQKNNDGSYKFPNDLKYETAKWADYVYVTSPPLTKNPFLSAAVVTDNVKAWRAALLAEIQLQAKLKERINSVINAQYFGGSSAYKTKVNTTRDQVVQNIKTLAPAVDACFTTLDATNVYSVANCYAKYLATTKNATAVYKTGLTLASLEAPLVKTTIKPALGCKPTALHPCNTRTDFVKAVTPGVGIYGEWTDYVMCPAGTFAVGYAMRVEPSLGGGGDDTGLNAVELRCRPLGGGTVKAIRPHEGLWGTWFDGGSTCLQGAMHNMNVKLEAFQNGGDDTGANDLNAVCTSGETLNAPGGGAWGDWQVPSEDQKCPGGTAVCGAKVRFQAAQGGLKDDTAMNGITLACCAL
jgi:hypothetical protein